MVPIGKEENRTKASQIDDMCLWFMLLYIVFVFGTTMGIHPLVRAFCAITALLFLFFVSHLCAGFSTCYCSFVMYCPSKHDYILTVSRKHLHSFCGNVFSIMFKNIECGVTGRSGVRFFFFLISTSTVPQQHNDLQWAWYLYIVKENVFQLFWRMYRKDFTNHS